MYELDKYSYKYGAFMWLKLSKEFCRTISRYIESDILEYTLVGRFFMIVNYLIYL
jgi:hypothetical protein